MAVLVAPGRPQHRVDEPEPTVLCRVSEQAVRYGASLGLVDRRRLAMRLYLFNRLPATPRWARQFPGTPEVAEAWGLRGSLETALGERWTWSAWPDRTYWWSWTTAGTMKRPAGKLYVSPQPQHGALALRATIKVLALTRSQVSIKIAADPSGLLRPDKLVCHFADPEELLTTARLLSHELRGIPAHGVPFALPVHPGGTGLVSIAADPPPTEGVRVSWRWWVSMKIADALTSTSCRPASSTDVALDVLRETQSRTRSRFASFTTDPSCRGQVSGD